MNYDDYNPREVAIGPAWAGETEPWGAAAPVEAARIEEAGAIEAKPAPASILTASQRERTPNITWPPGYAMTSHGLVFSGPQGEERICGPFEVTGQGRDEANGSWSVALAWRDGDGHHHTALISKASLMGEGVDCLRPLADRGLDMPTASAKLMKLKAALGEVTCTARIRMVSRTARRCLRPSEPNGRPFTGSCSVPGASNRGAVRRLGIPLRMARHGCKAVRGKHAPPSVRVCGLRRTSLRSHAGGARECPPRRPVVVREVDGSDSRRLCMGRRRTKRLRANVARHRQWP
jgi:hypothetical protein